MSVSPADFMDSASALSLGADEMAQRNALSRAYYAAFHRAAVSYPPEENRRGGTGMHRNYLDQLQNHQAGSKERIVGAKLTQLYQRRVLADYRLQNSLQTDAVARQLDTAKQIFSLLD